MAFDERRYVHDVLEPARASGNQPPGDLRARYALPDPLRPREVAESVKSVRMCWRKARGQLRFRRLVDRLEGEHLDLAPLFERAAAGDLAPLRAELTATRQRAERRREELRARVLDAGGELGMLTPGDLREIGGQAEALARECGIEVREPDPLPTRPPYPGYPRARDALDALGRRHLREFITGGPRAGRVLGPAPDLRRPAEQVREQWSRRAHDGNRTSADTVLIMLRHSAGRLGELILYDVVARLRERHQQRASERALLGFAISELGVDEDDARRLVFAVRREAGPPNALAARLRDLIDAGEVQAAAELAAGSAELTGEAEVLAKEARRRISAAAALRQEAASLMLSDSDQAWLRLADALRLAGDLPGAEALRAGLAPGPPGRVEVVVDGGQAALSWPPTPSRAGRIGYEVARRVGRAPRHPGDGEDLKVLPRPALPGPRPGAGTHAIDTSPPLNAPVYYAVFAVRDGIVSPPATAGPVYVRPAPAGVALRASDGVVAGHWNCPAEAARVIVTRDGVPVPAERTGLRDEAVRNGTTYRYRISCAYLDADGREVITSGVHVAATPTARPDPVRELTVSHDPGGDIVVTYDEPRNGNVEMVALPGPPPWPAGTTLPWAEVRQAGKVLDTSPVPGGVSLRTGPGVLLAVSVSGETATVGAHREHVSLTPPRELFTERRGEVIMLGFDWPPDVTETEVRWRRDGGEIRRLPVGRAGYDAHGGVRLTAPGDAAVTIEVAAAGTAYGERVTGAPVTAVVPGRTLVGYDLSRSRVRGITVTLSAAVPARLRRFVLVARSGPMPQRSGDGETVMSWEDVEVPARLRAPMPRLGRPFWLRCFAEDDTIELRDPPVRRLKVG